MTVPTETAAAASLRHRCDGFALTTTPIGPESYTQSPSTLEYSDWTVNVPVLSVMVWYPGHSSAISPPGLLFHPFRNGEDIVSAYSCPSPAVNLPLLSPVGVQ